MGLSRAAKAATLQGVIRVPKTLREGPFRDQVPRIVDEVFRSIDPHRLVLDQVSREGHTLFVAGERLDLRSIRRVVLLGAGKAGAPMARAVHDRLGDVLDAGYVACAVPEEHRLGTLHLRPGGHPAPDARSTQAGARIAAWCDDLTADDLAIFVLSGGASSMMCVPKAHLRVEAIARVLRALMQAGADITALNTVRRHLDDAKGGHLARRAWPARVITLAISDVPSGEDEASTLGSGPTSADRSTFAEAEATLRAHGLVEREHPEVFEILKRGIAGELAESVKPGDPRLARTRFVRLAGRDTAVATALRAATAVGFRSELARTELRGEAAPCGRTFAREVLATPPNPTLPTCWITQGETTVRVRGQGHGGRTLEFALGAAQELASKPIVLLSLTTDGRDGPTDAAGAAVDGSTTARLGALRLCADVALADNDTYPLFAALDDLYVTGDTGTNVGDLALAITTPPTGA